MEISWNSRWSFKVGEMRERTGLWFWWFISVFVLFIMSWVFSSVCMNEEELQRRLYCVSRYSLYACVGGRWIPCCAIVMETIQMWWYNFLHLLLWSLNYSWLMLAFWKLWNICSDWSRRRSRHVVASSYSYTLRTRRDSPRRKEHSTSRWHQDHFILFLLLSTTTQSCYLQNNTTCSQNCYTSFRITSHSFSYFTIKLSPSSLVLNSPRCTG